MHVLRTDHFGRDFEVNILAEDRIIARGRRDFPFHHFVHSSLSAGSCGCEPGVLLDFFFF